MRVAAFLGSIVAISLYTNSFAAEEKVLNELVPTGQLRVGVAFAPAPTPIFVAKQADGSVRGPAFDIGTALAKKLGVPVALTVVATTGELTELCNSGKIDIGFMPADADRRKILDFSPPYFVIESTYITTAASGITSMADVDRSDVKIAGISGSTTMRAATRSLKQASVVTAKSVDEAMAMMKANEVQAFALTHDSLPKLQQQLPGSHILDGAFQTVGVAIGVQKNKPAALAYVTEFVDAAKKDGTIRQFFDGAGLKQLAVAPQ